MNSPVSISLATVGEAPLVASLLQLCLHDLSAWHPRPIRPDGSFAYPWFALYWESSRRYPYLLRSAGDIAGFALVRAKEADETADWDFAVAEFFVLPRERRHGVGLAGAGHVLNQHPGLFEVSYDRRNVAAKNFWRRVSAEYGDPGPMPMGEHGERYLLHAGPR